jgi:hypothetical protein
MFCSLTFVNELRWLLGSRFVAITCEPDRDAGFCGVQPGIGSYRCDVAMQRDVGGNGQL